MKRLKLSARAASHFAIKYDTAGEVREVPINRKILLIAPATACYISQCLPTSPAVSNMRKSPDAIMISGLRRSAPFLVRTGSACLITSLPLRDLQHVAEDRGEAGRVAPRFRRRVPLREKSVHGGLRACKRCPAATATDDRAREGADCPAPRAPCVDWT